MWEKADGTTATDAAKIDNAKACDKAFEGKGLTGKFIKATDVVKHTTKQPAEGTAPAGSTGLVAAVSSLALSMMYL